MYTNDIGLTSKSVTKLILFSLLFLYCLVFYLCVYVCVCVHFVSLKCYYWSNASNTETV